MDGIEGQLLADARRRAGLSQRRLAAIAGTSQAMIARIEAGRQSPSLATLRRLVRACGQDLHLHVEGYGGSSPPAPSAAESAPRRVPGFSPPGRGRHLLLRLGTGIVAVPVAQIREVLSAREVRPLPGQPDGMAGVTAVRGTPIPCIDLARRLGGPPVARGPIAVLETPAGPVGALVGGADRVIDLTPDMISEIPPAWSREPLLRALARVDDDLLPVLDLAAVTLSESPGDRRRSKPDERGAGRAPPRT